MVEYVRAAVSAVPGAERKADALHKGKVQAYVRVLSGTTRAGSRGEEKGAVLKRARGDIHAGSKSAAA